MRTTRTPVPFQFFPQEEGRPTRFRFRTLVLALARSRHIRQVYLRPKVIGTCVYYTSRLCRTLFGLQKQSCFF